MIISNLTFSTLILLIGTSFCIVGLIICILTAFSKISNYLGNYTYLTSPKGHLFIFFGFLTFSLSDIYNQKWLTFFIQIMISILYLGIYIIQRNIYLQKIKDEIR